MLGESSWVIVLLGASLLVNLITMVFMIVLFKKNGAGAGASRKGGSRTAAAQVETAAAAVVSGIVFCRGCGNQYDSIHAACPSCETVR